MRTPTAERNSPTAEDAARPAGPARPHRSTTDDGDAPMATYRMVYGDDEQVVRETFEDVDVEREDGWTVLFRGDAAILRVQDAHVQSLERVDPRPDDQDRKSTRLNSSHANISYAVFCLKKKKQILNGSRY